MTALLWVGDGADRRRQREHHVILRHRQQFGLALGEPLLRRGALAPRTMPVAAGVVGDVRVLALLAARNVAAEGRRAAALDRRHHLQLAEAHMAGIGPVPCRSMAAEDIRDLQRRAQHARRALAGRPHLLELQRDMLQRAHDLLDRLGGNPRIERGAVELGVPRSVQPYLIPAAALSSRETSTGLSTTGSLRGSRTKCVCSTMAYRLSVTRERNRSADTV